MIDQKIIKNINKIFDLAKLVEEKVEEDKDISRELKTLLSIEKDVAKVARADPSILGSREYITLVETIGYSYISMEDYSTGVKYLERSADIYYNPGVTYSIAMNKLYAADYRGLRDYHSRYKVGDGSFKIPPFPMEQVTDISRLRGDDKLLILNEQGIGDEILFSRVFKSIERYCNDITIKVRPELLEYFSERYHSTNIRFITEPLPQREVLEFTCWSMLGDLFASLPEERMFYPKLTFEIPDNLRIGLSYTHGSLDKSEETPRSLKIKSMRGIEPEFFTKILSDCDLLDKTIDFSYGESINGMQAYPNPKDFKETYDNLIKEGINLVITLDSAFGHFTADMGINTIICYDRYFDWRWRIQDSGKLFFPNLKVCHKKELFKILRNKTI